MAVGLVGLGVLLSAVQWVPSKELLDRSPRAGGLSYEELTYASWHPELLPTLVMREAYGTRARDTDWMNGFYPYHEMNAYLGLIGLVPGGDRCRGARAARPLGELLGAAGGDRRHPDARQVHVPVRPRPQDPGRWAARASRSGSISGSRSRLAALAAVGVERLGRPGEVRLPDRRDPGPGPGRRVDPDPALRLRPGLDASERGGHRRITSPDTDGWARQFIGAAIRDAVLLVLGLALMWWAARARPPAAGCASPGRFRSSS